jgi:transcriptional regulator with XRE-family HTH domain
MSASLRLSPSRLRAARTRLGLSQRALARAVGSAHSTILRAEQGRLAVSVGLAYRIAYQLSVGGYELRPTLWERLRWRLAGERR